MARQNLSAWIHHLLNEYGTLESWMLQRYGKVPLPRKMQQIRHQWVDWMISTLEKED